MKRILRITESHLNHLIENEILNEINVINETITVKGAKVSPVKIDWGGPEGKYSGQLKIIYDEKEIYYKLSVEHWAYSGPILVTNLWKNTDKGEYKVKDSTGKVFSVTNTEMNKIVSNAITEIRTFTIKGEATVTFNKTS